MNGNGTLDAAEVQEKCMVNVLKVEIIAPKWTPDFPSDYSDINFSFDTATPGVCDIASEGTCGVPSLNPNLEWELTSRTGGDAVPGSTMTSSPDPAKGANVTFTFTDLPALNSSFGGSKMLTLDYPGSGCTPANEELRIFFSRDAKNHPGTGSGTVPNWYFYWKQTSADFGTHEYRAGSRSYCDYEGGSWRCFIEDSTVTYGVFLHNIQTVTDYSCPVGINHYAFVVRHEEQHRIDMSSSSNWGSAARVAALDADADWLKDANEATFISGRPYLNTTNATYPDL